MKLRNIFLSACVCTAFISCDVKGANDDNIDDNINTNSIIFIESIFINPGKSIHPFVAFSACLLMIGSLYILAFPLKFVLMPVLPLIMTVPTACQTLYATERKKYHNILSSCALWGLAIIGLILPQ